MLPSWVQHRDGRLVPFDADGISQTLFAAAQTLGPADAFLVRELTDGVLHFLHEEDLPDTATSDQIAEGIEKIVRELGQPALARAFAERRSTSPLNLPPPTLAVPYAIGDSPDSVVRRCLEEFTLRSVFSADIAAAHDQRLIQLGGLSTPRHLESVLLEHVAVEGLDPLELARSMVTGGATRAGGRLVLDSPEWLVPGDSIPSFVRELSRTARACGRVVEIHLNVAEPPNWAVPSGTGPLFAPDAFQPSDHRSQWLLAIDAADAHLNLAWHWQNEPKLDAHFVDWLDRSNGLQSRGTVVFDRPRSPISLGRGLHRRAPAVSIAVGLRLNELLHRPDVACQSDLFLEKIGSLARLAIAAGVQKRASLRKHADHLSRAFLLDRAAVALIPLDVSEVLRQLLGVSGLGSPFARAFLGQILTAIARPMADARFRTGLELLLEPPQESLTDDPAQLDDALPEKMSCREAILRPLPTPAVLDSVSRSTRLTAVRFGAGHTVERRI